MKKMLRLNLSAIILVASLSPAPVSAGNLGVAADYNIFALADFVQHGTDSLGRVAVGGKFDPGGKVGSGVLDGTSSYTVASSNPTSTAATPNLVVGGNFRNTGTTLSGDAWVQGNAFFQGPTVTGNITTGGNLTASGGGFVNGNISYGGTLYNNEGYKFWGGTSTHLTSAPTAPFNFTTEGNNLKQLSTTLGVMAGTGSVQFTGNARTNTLGGFTLTGTNSTQDIFHINGADLALANSMTINAVAGETIVLDINGSTDRMAGFSIILNNIDNHHLLYNFTDATSLTINNISIQGTVLAPFANVDFAGGNIDGTMIANSVMGIGESHSFSFTGNVNLLPAAVNVPHATVPEPSTLVSACVGLLMVGFAVRRKISKS